MAEELGCAVLVVVHLNKQRGGEPLYRIGGSIGQVAAARSVLGFGRDPEDPDDDRGSRRLLGHLASNWGRSLRRSCSSSRRWVSRSTTSGSRRRGSSTAARPTRAPRTPSELAGETTAARTARRRSSRLLDDGEPHPSREVKTAVMEELAVERATVKRAAKRLVDRGEDRRARTIELGSGWRSQARPSGSSSRHQS